MISVTLTINWSYQNRERTSQNAAFSTVEIFSGTEKARAVSSKVSINCFSHRTPTRQTDQIQKLVNRVCQLPISFFLFSGFLTVSKWSIVLYCIVLYCIVLYCIVLYCIVLYCIVLYCIVHRGLLLSEPNRFLMKTGFPVFLGVSLYLIWFPVWLFFSGSVTLLPWNGGLIFG